ncbi:GerAB/ArcD/ProY family transporter [Alkaliphilus sp. B6464]|uniref:GerAB/ArcD/ProY family transporter n=1 Tax=Alkaliphilus sp. B6464 TaxID=2731219 RepID=UPI001BA5FCDF|nr:endospore germination permease [Alkaliphilus sp. B6464]QUH19689.1 endospore germination permease [Alkaliphilus sp. B6464]
MQDNNDIIPIGQMIFILMIAMVGAGILTLPRDLAEIVPYDHWIVLLAGGLVAIVGALIHGAIIRLKPRKQYFEILCDALTKPIAYIVGLTYVLYLVGFIGLLTRIFGEVIKVYLLTNTPLEVITISILAAAIYSARKGIEVLGRMMQFGFPSVVTTIVFIFALSFTRSDFANLLPVFEITPAEILKGTPTTILSFIGIEMILFFGVHLEQPKKATKAYIAVVAILLFYMLIVTATLAQFGPIQVKSLLWPTLDLFDTIELPGLFIENIQVVVMSLWVLTIFSTTAPMFLAATVMTESLTGSKDHAYLAAPFLPLVYLVSIIPENISKTYEIMNIYTRYVASAMIFVVPLIVLISLVIQKKLRREEKVNV